MSQLIRLGHSPDPDDAFMFYAMAKKKIDLRGLTFEHLLMDIQTLNEWAQEPRPRLDVTALSIFAYGQVASQYNFLPYGISMGEQYGPLVISKKPLHASQLSGKRVAVPGRQTTAFLVLSMFFPDFIPVVKPFDQIMEAVADQTVEAGLIIHEGQLTYQKQGLVKVLDLGEYWYQQTKLPLPLGMNAVRSDLDRQVQSDIKAVLGESIQFALTHRDEAVAYALPFGRGLDTGLADRFIAMYVNRFSEELGDRGREAVQVLLNMDYEKKFLTSREVPTLV